MHMPPFQGDDFASTTASTPHTLDSMPEALERTPEEVAAAILSAQGHLAAIDTDSAWLLATANSGRTTACAWMQSGHLWIIRLASLDPLPSGPPTTASSSTLTRSTRCVVAP